METRTPEKAPIFPSKVYIPRVLQIQTPTPKEMPSFHPFIKK